VQGLTSSPIPGMESSHPARVPPGRNLSRKKGAPPRPSQFLASRKAAAPLLAFRISAADLALARKQAERKGLPDQIDIKSLLHNTLTEREKRKAGW